MVVLNCDIFCAMFGRKKSVNKQKLEHKLYLARETPEPIFDLSECDLINIPQGIYSLCKVFLKETLDLHCNQISSLSGGGELKDLSNLRVLDLSHNDFHYLPENIEHLKHLQDLILDHNHLKTLPPALCNLKNLQTLSLSGNKLKSLPDNLGLLRNLQKIKLKGNPQLQRLPKSICMAPKLIALELDAECFVYPPSEVAEGGTEAIVRFISADTGQEYSPPERVDEVEEAVGCYCEDVADGVQQKRLQDFLELERNNELLQRAEVEMAFAHKVKRDKLLASITDQQCKFDLKLGQIQLEKETERFRLVEQLQQAENNAETAINNLLTLNKQPFSQLLLDKEREEEERLLEAVSRYNEDLRKDAILAEMQDILRQETEAFNKFHKDRIEVSRSILEQELDAGSKIAEILQNQDAHKASLVSQLTEDHNLQRAAVGTLLERGDARSWGLLQQVRLVESQLGALTHIELDRRKLRMDEHLNDLAEKRINLSALLMDLLEQQRLRRSQLLSTLQTMEESNCDGLEDFWLRQYQSLLEKFPEGLSHAQKNMDPKLVETLLASGVIHCLPFLAKLTQSNTREVSEGDLIEAGLTSSRDRERILEALRIYSKERACYAPSAPPVECDAGASAPPMEDDQIKAINSVECVICLDLQCHVIFVPCGHLCCCTGCSVGVSHCPLCRTDIKRRITKVPQ